MRIKLDENLPSRLAFLLGRFGHDVDTVHSEGLSGCRDDALWEECQKKQRFLITQDLEFTALNRVTCRGGLSRRSCSLTTCGAKLEERRLKPEAHRATCGGVARRAKTQAGSSRPSSEKYALTSQIRRSSRSVCLNLREAWAKRRYEAHFISKLTDCDGENSETDSSLDFAKDCQYINIEKHSELTAFCEEIGKMIGSMIKNPKPFTTGQHKP